VEILIENLSVRFADKSGGETIDALVNVEPCDQAGRVRVAGGAVVLRQDDAHAHHRRPSEAVGGRHHRAGPDAQADPPAEECTASCFR
jgi:hypothetical protein